MIDPKHLLVFSKVVECRGLSAAARVLGMPKASVSRAIARMERDLSSRLLERSSRKLRLTEAGRVLFEHSVRVAEELEAAETAIDDLQRAVRGRLKVAVPFTFGHFLLSPILSDFLSRFPDIQLELELTNRRVDPIEENFDVVVCVGTLESSEMIVKTIGHVTYGLFATAKYMQTAPPLGHPNDLANHTLLGSFVGPERKVWKFSDGESNCDVQIALSRLEVNDPVVRLDAVIGDLGVALLPLWIVRSRKMDERLVELLPRWKAAVSAHVNVLYPSRRSLTVKSRVFVQFLEERIAPLLER